MSSRSYREVIASMRQSLEDVKLALLRQNSNGFIQASDRFYEASDQIVDTLVELPEPPVGCEDFFRMQEEMHRYNTAAFQVIMIAECPRRPC